MMLENLFCSGFDSDRDIFLYNISVNLFYNILTKIRSKRSNEGFIEIMSPFIVHNSTFKTSGHLDLFHDNMFIKDSFSIKPMNCPLHARYVKKLLLKDKYSKENPIKIFELAHVVRNEDSGSMIPLLRSNSFHQDDIHIFCFDKDQLEEYLDILLKDWIILFKSILNIDFKIVLSTMPNKSLAKENNRYESNQLLIQVLINNNINLEVMEGEGAFYGPKLDLLVLLNEKYVQLSTIQIDFFLARNFNLPFYAVIHSALFGSLQRFLYVIKNLFNGFPFWMDDNYFLLINLLKKQSRSYLNLITKKLKNNKINYKVLDTFDRNLIKKHVYQNLKELWMIGEIEVLNKSLSIRSKNYFKTVDLKLYLDDICSKKCMIDNFFKLT